MRKANVPVVDDNGLSVLTVTDIKFHQVQDVHALKRGAPPDEAQYEAFDIVFTVPGTTADITLKERCGAVVNPQPLETKNRGKTKVYNKLTTCLLQMGLTTVEDLESAGDAELEDLKNRFLGIAGTQYTCILMKVDGFHRIDLKTIKPVK